jgi:hypothetical protein
MQNPHKACRYRLIHIIGRVLFPRDISGPSPLVGEGLTGGLSVEECSDESMSVAIDYTLVYENVHARLTHVT